MTAPEHPRVVLGLQGVQTRDLAGSGVCRRAQDYLTALVAFQPEVVAGVSADTGLAAPDVVPDLPPDVPLLDTNDPAPPSGQPGVLVFHALACTTQSPPLDALWPRWARDPSVALVATADDVTAQELERPPHGSAGYRLRSIRNFLENADAVICESQSAAAAVSGAALVDPDRLHVVLQGCPPAHPVPEDPKVPVEGAFGAGRGMEPGHLLTITTGRLVSDMEVAIRAYALLPEGIRNRHQLVVAGWTSTSRAESLHDVAASCGVSRRVVLLPGIGQAGCRSLLRSCHLAVLPRPDGPSVRPALEAIARGAPLLVGDVNPLREVVQDSSARFDPGSVHSLYHAMARALTSDEILRELTDAPRFALKRHDWLASTATAVGAYRAAASRRP